MTSISKNVYIDKLAGIVNEYNNTYQSTMKMKSVDVTFSTLLKYIIFLAKGYVQNWSEEVFMLKKV